MTLWERRPDVLGAFLRGLLVIRLMVYQFFFFFVVWGGGPK